MDGSYGVSYGSSGCPGRVSPASKLQMVPMVAPMVPMAARVGFPGLGVTDRMSVHVLDEEQLAPLRVR